ncbi:MAG: phosphate signaling complex protein PhoU [Anaerolineales bacterium]|nr:phosphate signaling complex protein PhoU [Chloroflexota bacterium]MBL6979791.1 phosphate signaling complex protein PhoU [Anaerolineales bacterium]
MTRETLDKKIQGLLDDVLTLGSMVEEAILDSVRALKKRDQELAKKIYEGDKKINKRRYKIERSTVTVIATQQPMASDLRILASIIEVAGEIERMGDYAKGIALITSRLGDEPPVKPLIDIPKMADLTADMLHRALGAFVEADVDTALEIPSEDDQVDHLYNQVYRELLTCMMANPETIDGATLLLWVAHNLERVADRVTNICERTRYVATGKLKDIDVSDDEQFLDD